MAGFDNIPVVQPLIRSGKMLAMVEQYGAQMAAMGIDYGLHELADGQLVATRPLAGLTIGEIVRMMVGRTIQEEHVFRPEVAVGGEILRAEGLQRTARSPAVSFAVRLFKASSLVTAGIDASDC